LSKAGRSAFKFGGNNLEITRCRVGLMVKGAHSVAQVVDDKELLRMFAEDLYRAGACETDEHFPGCDSGSKVAPMKILCQVWVRAPPGAHQKVRRWCLLLTAERPAQPNF
jgi:hypothetical protein